AAAIAAFADAVLSGRRITIFGDGTQTRDFVPVGDLVQCLLKAATWAGPARAEVFNVGHGRATSVRELASIIAALAGVGDDPVLAPARPGDVKHSLADISRATKTLGYRPQVRVPDALRQTLDWYRTQLARART